MTHVIASGFVSSSQQTINLMVPRREVESAVFPAVFDCVPSASVDRRLFRSLRCPQGENFTYSWCLLLPSGELVLKLHFVLRESTVAMEHPPFIDDFPIKNST